MKKSEPIVSVDIGSGSIKLVELEKTPQGWEILNFLEKQIPSGFQGKNADEIIPELLKKTFLEAEIKIASIITFLPRRLFSVKHISLPSENYNEISQMFSFEAEKAFPFSLAKFELGFAVQEILPENNSKILAAAVEKTILQKLLNQLEKAGLTIKRIGLSSLSLAKTYLSQEKANAVLINLGEAASEINIIYQERLTFSRSFPIAGKHFTQALMKDLDLNEPAAEKTKLEGNWPKEKELPSVENWYRQLTLEIKRTMECFLKDYPEAALNQIVLSGGGSKLTGIQEVLSSKLNFKTILFPFSFKNIQISEEGKKKFLEKAHLYPIALGGALEESEEHPFNLIPEEYRKQREQKKKRQKIIFTTLAAVSLLFLLEVFIGASLLWQTGRKKLIQRNLLRMKPVVTEVIDRKEEIKLLEAYLKKFSPLEVLRNLSQILPENILITRLSLDKNGLGQMTGMTMEHSQVSDLIKTIEKSPQFYNVFSRYSRSKNKKGKNLVEFVISFSVER